MDPSILFENPHRGAIRAIRRTLKNYTQYVDAEWFSLNAELDQHYKLLPKNEQARYG